MATESVIQSAEQNYVVSQHRRVLCNVPRVFREAIKIKTDRGDRTLSEVN